MSNFLAIATVTETLRQLLQAAVDSDLPGTTVTMARPEDQPAGPGGSRVNVFLYQVKPNAALRNSDLPARRASGLLQERPVAALDLQYLFSFSGNEAQLEPQRLLGSVVRTLHGRPMLTRQMLLDALSSTTLGFLANSNLVDQIELVKLTPLALTLEELSNLWSVFFQTPFVLSVAYEAAVVLIEEEETPFSPLPVQRRNLLVLPFRHPLVERVQAATGPNAPIVAGDTLLLRGQRLQGDVTRVRIGGQIVTPTSVSDSEVALPVTAPPLPAAALRAGVQGIQVVQEIVFGSPGDPHRGFESNVAPFVLRPTVTAATVAGAVVTVNVDPAVRVGQRVNLLLNQNTTVDPLAFSFAADVPSVDTTTIQVTTAGVIAGDYFLRLQVDGAESPIDLDPASPTFGPVVTFT